MKQYTGKKQTKAPEPKVNYGRFAFWFPLLYGVVNAFIMFLNFTIIANGGAVRNVELAMSLARVFVVLCIFSPSMLIFVLFISKKHMAKYKHASSLYSKAPGIFCSMVLIMELVYILTQVVR